jgi:hypothetical protein
VSRGHAVVERRHQVGVGAVVRVLAGVRIVAAGLYPEDLGPYAARHRASDRAQRLAEPVVGIRDRRRVRRDLGDAIERGERRDRTAVDERQVRAVDGHVRGDCRGGRALEGRLARVALVGARERISGHVRDRRHADVPGHQRPRRLARGVPPHERVDRARQRIGIPAEPPGPLRRGRVGRRPDVGAEKMRPARVRVSRALDDREPAGIEDLLQPRETRMETERHTTPIAADLQDVPRLHRERRPPAEVKAVVVGHERAERVVPAGEVQHDQVAAARSLRPRQVAEECRRRERRRGEPIEHVREERFRGCGMRARLLAEVEPLVGRELRGEVHPRQHRAGRIPPTTEVPAVDIRRLEELLPHVRHRAERVVDGKAAPADFLDRPRDELGRPRIASEVVRRVAEVPRHQDAPDDGLHHVAAPVVLGCDVVDEVLGWGRVLAHEERPELPREPPAGLGMPRDGIDQVDPVLHPVGRRACRDRPPAVGIDRETELFRRRAVLVRVVVEPLERVTRGAREVPPGEHARAGVDVRLGEEPDAHREQLHQLPRVVLLRPVPEVRPAVKPDEHRGISRDFDQDIAEVAERVLAQELELTLDASGIFVRLRGHRARAVVGPEPA